VITFETKKAQKKERKNLWKCVRVHGRRYNGEGEERKKALVKKNFIKKNRQVC